LPSNPTGQPGKLSISLSAGWGSTNATIQITDIWLSK